ncbi:MAG: Sec-independent protein translocase TatB [Acidocella sp. 21-58-7]|nr:MAG: Sec-independent protein translocase TatB [Acidocella sp. 21-58-7]
MFGFSWAEIGLILAVALIAIGPKDLPIAIKTVTGLMKKARGMAAEFQGHVDEMMRDANLSEVKTELNKLRRFDFKAAAEQTIDPDGSIKSALSEADFGENAMRPVPNTIYIPPDAARKQPVPAFIPPGTKRWGY